MDFNLIVTIGIAVIIAVTLIICVLTGKTKAIKEWLKYAVAEAEEFFGSNTGKLKLQYVYTEFIDRFSFMANFISFTMFSRWVDTALETLADWLHNEDIAAVIAPPEADDQEDNDNG